jgi:hypothetical protein
MLALRPLAAATLLAIAAAGCAEPGVVKQIEPNSYSLSENYSRGLFDSARQRGVSRAADFCFKMDRRVLVDYVLQGLTNGHGGGSAEVTFRCLNRGDPELQRPG